MTTMDEYTQDMHLEPKTQFWHGFRIKKEISVMGVVAFLVSFAGAGVAIVKTVGNWEATLVSVVDKVQIQQTELEFLRGLPERVAKVEEKIEQNGKKQSEALEEIKTLIVQTRPRNSAPSLQTQRR